MDEAVGESIPHCLAQPERRDFAVRPQQQLVPRQSGYRPLPLVVGDEKVRDALLLPSAPPWPTGWGWPLHRCPQPTQHRARGCEGNPLQLRGKPLAPPDVGAPLQVRGEDGDRD